MANATSYRYTFCAEDARMPTCMKRGRISQTALKVGYGLITLSSKEEWSRRLPEGLVDKTERLILASGAFGYGPRLLRAARKPWMLRVHEFQDRMMPGQFEGFGHRKIFIQQEVESAIAAEARQVLVLGAGFDTLSLRLAPVFPDVNFFELDHPNTSAAKARGVTEEGWPENMTLIAADLGQQKLSAGVVEHDRWDASRRSIVVAEGLLQYLSDDDVRTLLVEAAASVAAKSRLVFSHLVPDDRKLLKRLLRLTGEPALSSVSSEDLPEYVDGTGWTVTSDVDTDQDHGIERYAVAERT